MNIWRLCRPRSPRWFSINQPVVPTWRHTKVRREHGASENQALHAEWALSSLSPDPMAERWSEKLGQAHLVLKWFFARKGTAKPHFSINTYLSLSLSLSHSLSVSLSCSCGWGPLTGPGSDPETVCCNSEGHFSDDSIYINLSSSRLLSAGEDLEAHVGEEAIKYTKTNVRTSLWFLHFR